MLLCHGSLRLTCIHRRTCIRPAWSEGANAKPYSPCKIKAFLTKRFPKADLSALNLDPWDHDVLGWQLEMQVGTHVTEILPPEGNDAPEVAYHEILTRDEAVLTDHGLESGSFPWFAYFVTRECSVGGAPEVIAPWDCHVPLSSSSGAAGGLPR